MRLLAGAVLLAVASAVVRAEPSALAEPQERASRIAILQALPERDVAKFGKLEISFTLDTSASMLHWPYDVTPPRGIPAGLGVDANAIFVDPRGREYVQPAFYYQQFEDAVRNGRDWHYPTDTLVWKVRFSPNQSGTWKFRLTARDRRGATATEWRTFEVAPSAHRGFVRVSRADSRYFEFDDGTFFTGLGFQVPEYLENPDTAGASAYRELSANGVNFVRFWLGSIYGSAWTPYVGGRNRYAGYLPVAGLVPFADALTGETSLTMRMDYEPEGDTRWFDACRLQWGDDLAPVKPLTRYRIRGVYSGRDIAGPRNPRAAGFGFVVKLGGMFPTCHEPGTSHAVTGYGRDTTQFSQVEGIWNSGNRTFLPKLHLALENVSQGAVYVKSVSVREIRQDGSEGPEILAKPSMAFELDIPQAKAYALDKIVTMAERSGVYLKLVVMEKDDEIYLKTGDDGSFVTDRDNHDGVYGVGRAMNRTRWLQQAWWRYLQARWGYSPSIHSWELLNEGDPSAVRHYELADEFGRFMHFGVFGATPGSSYDHPNDHLVTTSFWHSFPAVEFWANRRYPHVDYADVHAYVSTSMAPQVEKQRMQSDSAYYHTWHSQAVAASRIGKPVVRGEAGLDLPGRQDEFALGVQRDRSGVWLHNFLWSGLDSGGLYELYWWRSHIWGRHGDHRSQYKSIGRFLSGLDLNKGGYTDWNGTVSHPQLRVLGQKNVSAGTMHLWVQNTAHTWKNVVEGRVNEPVSADIHVPGFSPGASYDVEWWDTWTADGNVGVRQTVSGATGTLTIAIAALQTDVALKVRPSTRLDSKSRKAG